MDLMQELQAEEATFRIARMQHQEKMTLKKEKEAAIRALKEADASLKQATKDRRRDEKVAMAMVAAKAFTLPQLGQGRKLGGNMAHQKHRRDVLERVREVAEMSPQQTCHWDLFKRVWDETMAETHGINWGKFFAEIVQNLLGDIYAGKTDALSLFMEKERQRVLGVVLALVIFAAPGG